MGSSQYLPSLIKKYVDGYQVQIFFSIITNHDRFTTRHFFLVRVKFVSSFNRFGLLNFAFGAIYKNIPSLQRRVDIQRRADTGIRPYETGSVELVPNRDFSSKGKKQASSTSSYSATGLLKKMGLLKSNAS